MSHSYDTAAIATQFGIATEDLGLALVTHELDGVTYENVLFFDKRHQGPRPGALSVPNFFGIRQQSLEIAAKTLGKGYAVFQADLYGQSVRPTVREEAQGIIKGLKSNRAELRKRMNAALDALRQQTVVDVSGIGAYGYCFGGTAALELARSGADLKAFASLHGGLDSPTPEDAKNIKGAILVLTGVQDPSVPQAQVAAFIDEMSNAKLDWQIVTYGQAGHSFTDPEAAAPGYFYHAPTERRSGIALRNFFDETLG